MKVKRALTKLITLVFLAFIISGFIHLCVYLVSNTVFNRKAIESYFLDINGKSQYINLYGLSQKVLGKKEIENFTIYKNTYNKLVEPRAKKTKDEIEKSVDSFSAIVQWTKDTSIPFFYVAPPLPITDEADLPYGVHDYSRQNAEYLHSKLKDIKIIDVANSIDVDKEHMFYRTDHHWSGEACFKAYNEIAEYLSAEEIINEKQNIKFEKVEIEGFLGSYGIKVGRYYNGRDQFVFYNPAKNLDIEFSEYSADGVLIRTHRGQWADALMDNEILTNPGYNNKYQAALWGNSGENRIINHNIKNGKLLLIAHSYGRPLAQYLAVDFHEIRHIDPQEGRFGGNYLRYIDDYKPDAILFLGEFEGEIIGEYRTSGQ
ncbi:MAG: hypothetical protein IKG44_02795 [Mogibacterium sp.]|nr:hypothetical protein [Mogibacterium sp.]